MAANQNFNRNTFNKILGVTLFLVLYRYAGDWAAKYFYEVEFVWSFSPHHYAESIITVLLILSINQYTNRWINIRFSWAKQIPALVVFHCVAAFIVSLIFTPSGMFISGLIRNDFGFDGLEVIFSTLINWGMALMVLTYSLITLLLKQWRDSIVEVERFKKESIEFRFETLKNQVNPHFLFNSLNTLSSLMHVDIEAAERYLRQLSKVYRYVLENRNMELISLETELNILDSYIYLVEMRFKGKLNIKINLPDHISKYGIAPMTLQMLIENAIKHNELSIELPLSIDITSTDEDYAVVRNRMQLKTSKEFSTKIGLSNIINRYQYLTDKKLVVDNSDKVFTVKVPLLDQQ